MEGWEEEEREREARTVEGCSLLRHRVRQCGNTGWTNVDLGTHADLSVIRLSSHMEAHDTDTCRALTHTASSSEGISQ